MAQPEKFTAEEMITAIVEARGFISVAADRLGCAPNTVRNYIARYATVKQAAHDTREKTKDFVESKLFKLIQDENVAAVIFFLKTQCKDRGYIERQEVTGADGGPQVIRIVDETESAK